MFRTFIFLLLLSRFKTLYCDLDLELRILRNSDENYSQVRTGVEEHVGNNLSLSCELSSTGFSAYDDQIIWGKSTNDFSFKNKTDLVILANKTSKRFYALAHQSDINRAQLKFIPLKISDEGLYFCGSIKYKLFELLEIVVQDVLWKQSGEEPKYKPVSPEYCNEKMFKCKSNGVCITQHYVCDKKVDCKDGSDESWETCNGDPCKDKLPCNDRCIPIHWCCNKHYDPKCNVTYPPPCCQRITTPYEDIEYGYIPYNMTQVKTGSTRYIFISLCILATFFSIMLMLLILSKVFLFAKKTSNMCTRNRDLFQLEEVGAQFRSNVPCSYRARNIISNARYSSNCRTDNVIPADVTNGTIDALLILSDDMIRFGDSADRPPSYTDIMGQLEPPPPYTSQDCLNQA